MVKSLKFATYETAAAVTEAINDRIYADPEKSLVQIIYESDTFFGSSRGRYVVFYNVGDKCEN